MREAFTKSTLITFITRILSSIFALVSLIVVARSLGPEGQGFYTLVILFSSLLATFTTFGITIATVFYTGKNKYSRQEIIGNNIILSLLIGFFSALIGFFIVFCFGERLFPGVEKEYLFLSLLVIPLIFFSGFISHILLGMERIKKFNILFLFQNFFLLLFLLIFLYVFKLGIKAAIVAYIFSFLFYGAVLFFATKKEVKGVIFKINLNYWKDAFIYGLKIYPSHVFSFLNFRASMFLINFFINPLAVGFYSVAVSLSEGLWIFSKSISTVLLPRVVSETNPQKLKEFTPLVCRNILFGLLIIIIPLFLAGRFLIIFLYSREFLESTIPFQILLLGTLPVCGWEILSSDIAGRGKQILNSYIGGISLILNIVLNIFFIPKWGVSGAAWAATISYFFMFFITVVIYKNMSNNKIRNIIFLQGSDIQLYKSLLDNIKNYKII